MAAEMKKNLLQWTFQTLWSETRGASVPAWFLCFFKKNDVFFSWRQMREIMM